MVPAVEKGAIYWASVFLHRTSYFRQTDTSMPAELPCRCSSFCATLIGALFESLWTQWKLNDDLSKITPEIHAFPCDTAELARLIHVWYFRVVRQHPPEGRRNQWKGGKNPKDWAYGDIARRTPRCNPPPHPPPILHALIQVRREWLWAVPSANPNASLRHKTVTPVQRLTRGRIRTHY